MKKIQPSEKSWHWYWGRPYDEYQYANVDVYHHTSSFWFLLLAWMVLFPESVGHLIGKIKTAAGF